MNKASKLIWRSGYKLQREANKALKEVKPKANKKKRTYMSKEYEEQYNEYFRKIEEIE